MMNDKLSKNLNSFPKNYELNKEAKLKIESAIQAEIYNIEKKKKWYSLTNQFKKLMLPMSCVAVVALLAVLFVSSDGFNLFQSSILNKETTDPVKEVQKDEITDLSTKWANALKTRDGKPRYEMMTEKAREKFIQEQKIRSGEKWNYNIGESSPWVVDFEIVVNGMNAVITYKTQTSEPVYYRTKETVSFVRENDRILVDEYQTIYENMGPVTEDLPSFVEESHFGKVDWNKKAVKFNGNIIGNENKSGVIGADMPSLNNNQKWMWHLWGIESIGQTKLTVVGLHRETNSIHQILSTGWTINLGGENNGADAHVPSSVNIPQPGEWAILLYTDGELFDILVFDINE